MIKVIYNSGKKYIYISKKYKSAEEFDRLLYPWSQLIFEYSSLK